MTALGLLTDWVTRGLMALHPRGALWPRDPGTVRYELMASLAAELARVIQAYEQILAERSPRTALQLLAEWEEVLGLPDPCSGEPETIAERRAIAHARMIATGGQSPAYFVELARALGFEIEIVQYRARWFGLRRFGELYGGEDMQFTWRVVERSGTTRPRRFGAAFHGEPYTVWGNLPLVCTLRRLRPAHTEIIFS